MRQFSRIYLEITNVCNRSCAFCPGTRRKPGMVTAEEFQVLAQKLRPHTDYLYLHVMGEPLVHPRLGDLLKIAGDLGFRVILTTNGTLLAEKAQVLLSSPALHKVHISLHSFEANEGGDFSAYVSSCADFGLAAQQAGVLVNYRLWNLDGTQTHGLHKRNQEILSALAARFPEPWKEAAQGKTLSKGVFLQYGERFDWPDLNAEHQGDRGFCYALRNQIAVLCDGTVVPCCLDHEGDIPLGNLFQQDLAEILSSPEANQIYQGFSARKRIHPLCQRCGYAQRFG